MALYHFSIKIISRGKGKSAVAASAYRSGECITNNYDGITHDFKRKRGIIHTEIILPDHAPRKFENRSVLWNSVEEVEKQRNSQLSREIEIALPVELTKGENISLARRFVKEQLVENGMCADLAVHNTDGTNPHVHIMLTMRPLNEDSSWGAKVIKINGKKTYPVDWDNRDNAEFWRKAWAAYLNTALRINGHNEVVDHRSFERQGIDQIPTIHLGTSASQMEKHGIRTERGDINREIMVNNSELRQIKSRLTKLHKWLEEEIKNNEQPALSDIITNILEKKNQTGNQSRYASINNLKVAADMLNFLTNNEIMDLPGLDKKLIDMLDTQSEIGDKLKPIERRLKTLDEHIKQAEIYREHTKINGLYQKQKPKDKDIFFEANRRELTLYQSAEKYLKNHLNGRNRIPMSAWKAEREKLTADKKRLYHEYQIIKDKTKKVERIRRNVQEIVRTETRSESRKRGRDLDL